MFQMDLEVVAPLGTMSILIIMVIIMLALFARFRIFPFIFVVFVFSLILGYMALEVDLPLSPYFQIFFIVFQTVIFFMAVIDLSKKRYK